MFRGIVEEIEKHCKSLLYPLLTRCSSIYNDTFALKGWKTEEINGIEFELNSILVESGKVKAYRLVIQRQKRMDGMGFLGRRIHIPLYPD